MYLVLKFKKYLIFKYILSMYLVFKYKKKYLVPSSVCNLVPTNSTVLGRRQEVIISQTPVATYLATDGEITFLEN